MRIVYGITGMLIMVMGVIALAAGEVNADGSWLLALWLGALGLAGLLGTIATAVSNRPDSSDR